MDEKETDAGAAEAKPVAGEGKGAGETAPARPAEDESDFEGGNALETIRDAAMEVCDRIEATEAFGHMRSNRGKLMRAVCSVLKKNGGAATARETGQKILSGLAAWSGCWKAEGWQYAPRRMVDWILDEKFREEVRTKPCGQNADGGSAERDYGEVGVKEIV